MASAARDDVLPTPMKDFLIPDEKITWFSREGTDARKFKTQFPKRVFRRRIDGIVARRHDVHAAV